VILSRYTDAVGESIVPGVEVSCGVFP